MKFVCVMFLCSFFSLNAQCAVDPSRPGLAINARERGSMFTVVRVGVINIGNAHLYFSDSAISDGGVFGYYSKDEPWKNWLAVSLPITPLIRWNENISTGIYYESSGIVTPITKLNMVVNDRYPFAWTIEPLSNTYGSGSMYNRVNFVPARTPNLKLSSDTKDNPRGAQIQPGELNDFAEKLNSSVDITVVSIDTFLRDDSMRADYMDTAQRSPTTNGGYNFSSIKLTPYSAGAVSAIAFGEVVISPKGKVISVPDTCLITQAPATSGMLCPFNAQGITGNVIYTAKDGVLFKSNSFDVGSTTLTTNISTYIFYPVSWMEAKLGINNSVDLVNYQSILVSGSSFQLFSAYFDQFSKLTINRTSFSAKLTERDGGGVHSGVVGQSPITIPYVINLMGDSKATSVNVSVNGDDTTTKMGVNYCAFNTESDNKKIAVPLSLNLYHPNNPFPLHSISSDCSGALMDIGSAPWFDIAGMNEINSELWLDMVFDLNSDLVQTDMDGNDWQGKAVGKGSITLEASWN